MIKNELINYLYLVNDTNFNNYNESYLTTLSSIKLSAKSIEWFYNEKISFENKININVFLNFNYTNTYLYLMNNTQMEYQNFNIHGNLKYSKDIIFGFGDENTNEYKEIENSEDIFLENIKSFKYLKNRNYDLITSYIKSDYYEVYLLGHSCSITDRVLLKKIFENPNCITIKILPKHGNDDERYQNYKEICFNIARIFDDNGMMRDKVIPFEDCDVHLPNYDKFEVKI